MFFVIVAYLGVREWFMKGIFLTIVKRTLLEMKQCSFLYFSFLYVGCRKCDDISLWISRCICGFRDWC